MENKTIINVSSDEFTEPDQQMIKMMSEAKVGDDVIGSDPSAIELQSLAAEMFDKQAALFTITSEMSNMVAIMTHSKPGDQIIINSYSNIGENYIDSVSFVGGVMTRQIHIKEGIFNKEVVIKMLRNSKNDIHIPTTSTIVIENPTTRGRVWPIERLQQLYELANQKSVNLHIDGDRIFNAIQYYSKSNPEQKDILKKIGSMCHSISICLDRGLGCPNGGLLMGSDAMILRARQNRKSLGGGMRQIGVLTAAGTYALKNRIKQLSEDNRMARIFAQKLRKLNQISIKTQEIDINTVFFEVLNQKKDQTLGQFLKSKHQIEIHQTPKKGQYQLFFYSNVRQQQIERIVNGINDYFN